MSLAADLAVFNTYLAAVDALKKAQDFPGALVRITIEDIAHRDIVKYLQIADQVDESIDWVKTSHGLGETDEGQPIIIELTNGSGIQIAVASKLKNSLKRAQS